MQDGKVVDTLEGANPSELANKVSKFSSRSLNHVSSVTPALEINGSPLFDSIIATSKTGLKGKLQQLVDSKPVLLFMKGTPDQPRCGFSRKDMEVLKEVGVEFSSFDILSDE